MVLLRFLLSTEWCNFVVIFRRVQILPTREFEIDSNRVTRLFNPVRRKKKLSRRAFLVLLQKEKLLLNSLLFLRMNLDKLFY